MRNGVELVEIEVVLVLAEELHFGRTARRLRLSPSRVTQLVQRFERRIGAVLFTRSSRRVRLTPLGATLVAELAPARAELDRCLRTATDRARGGEEVLRIGHIVTVEGTPALADAIAAFEHGCPGVRVRRLRFDLVEYVDALRRGEVDVWVGWWPGAPPGTDPDAGLCSGPVLARCPRALLVDRRHALAGRASISLDDLADHAVIDFPAGGPRLLRRHWVPATGPAGHPVARVDPFEWPGHFHELAGVLARGEDGWLTIATFLDTVSMPPSVVAVPVRDAEPFTLVPWWRGDGETPAIQAFAAAIAPPG